MDSESPDGLCHYQIIEFGDSVQRSLQLVDSCLPDITSLILTYWSNDRRVRKKLKTFAELVAVVEGAKFNAIEVNTICGAMQARFAIAPSPLSSYWQHIGDDPCKNRGHELQRRQFAAAEKSFRVKQIDIYPTVTDIYFGRPELSEPEMLKSLAHRIVSSHIDMGDGRLSGCCDFPSASTHLIGDNMLGEINHSQASYLALVGKVNRPYPVIFGSYEYCAAIEDCSAGFYTLVMESKSLICAVVASSVDEVSRFATIGCKKYFSAILVK